MKKKNWAVQRILKKLYKVIFQHLKEIFNVKVDDYERRQIVKEYLESSKFKQIKEQATNEITRALISHNKNEWRENYNENKEKKNLKLSPFVDLEQEIIEKIEQKSLELVTSIPQDVLELNSLQYVEELKANVLKGEAGRGDFEKFLTELEVKNAKLIARSETARMQSAVLEERSKKLESPGYKWLAAKDGRTRPSHKEMSGVIVKWGSDSDKPILDNMQGNAGEFPNCRCSPQPFFYEKDLSNDDMLKFYDPQAHKIIDIKREKLIKLLFQ